MAEGERVSGRTAVVTGASSGIGAATARRLAADGYRVIAAARREDRVRELAAEIGGVAIGLDVTDDGSVAALARSLDSCDVLVNNAGGAFDADPVEHGSIADWQASYEVNVIGSLRVTQALLPLLRRSSAASIVMMCSTASTVAYEGGGSYTAAKHAEHALTGTLRLELNGEPIRVIEIAPGMVKTDGFATHRFGGDQDRVDALYADVDRPLTAQDIADCVAVTLALPQHVNIDSLVVRPVAQAAQHKLFRGPLFDRAGSSPDS